MFLKIVSFIINLYRILIKMLRIYVYLFFFPFLYDDNYNYNDNYLIFYESIYDLLSKSIPIFF